MFVDKDAFRILVIDDEEVLRDELAQILNEEGYAVETAEDGTAGLAKALAYHPHLILSDISTPGLNGIEVLKQVQVLLPQVQTIMFTAYGTLEAAISALRFGAVDFIMKPIDLSDLQSKIERVRISAALLAEVQHLRREVAREQTSVLFEGKSQAIQDIRAIFDLLSGTWTTVMINGETGTGKEFVAREIHNRPPTVGRPFLTANCAAIPENLFESQLFGYARGTFTGALRDTMGLVEQANGGTLFLDEIGEMPLAMQAKLLRVIEEREVVRLGTANPIKVNVRFLAATNRDLLQMIREGRFREDLYYRLQVVEIKIPPLRERREDIPILADTILHQLNRDLKRHFLGLENEALRALMSYSWPGNVRELRNALERALLFHTSGHLKIEKLPADIVNAAQRETADQPIGLKDAMRTYERHHIESVLKSVSGNRDEAAALLGIDRSTLYRKLSEKGE